VRADDFFQQITLQQTRELGGVHARFGFVVCFVVVV
jgi:hypothetical protein